MNLLDYLLKEDLIWVTELNKAYFWKEADGHYVIMIYTDNTSINGKICWTLGFSFSC